MTATAIASPAAPPKTTQARKPRRSWAFHTVMAPVTLLWVLPLVFVILVSVRTFDDIASNGLGPGPPHSP